MDKHSNTYGFDSEQLPGFWIALQIVRGFINRLANLVRVTKQDLLDAGVYLRRMGD